MKRKYLIRLSIVFTLAISFSIFYLYLRTHQPLNSFGYGTYSYPDKKGITVDIKNDGFTSLFIKDIKVNNSNKPDKAQLGISTSGWFVQMFTPKENKERGTTFYDFNICNRVLHQNQDKLPVYDGKTTKIYGINVEYGNKIENIIIKYKYLGITFKKEIKINN